MWLRFARLAAVLCTCLLVFSPGTTSAASALAGKTIVIDPGEGGSEPGGVDFGVQEKDLNLSTSRYVGALLRSAGAQVVFTRSSDLTMSLARRSAIANSVGADAFVSIHANAIIDPTYSGVTTFYGQSAGYAGGITRSLTLVQEGQTLAVDVQSAVQQRTGEVNLGAQPADFYVLGYTQMPSILIETGYMTNQAELQRLATPAYQQQIAQGIVRGLSLFFSGGSASASAANVAPAAANAASPSNSTANSYTVQAGDTISGIALQFNVSQAALAQLNNLNAADTIVVGQQLAIPAPSATPPAARPGAAATAAGANSYTVQAGDTISGIALQFNVSQAALAQLNNLNAADTIVVGQQLTIPARNVMAAIAQPAATTLNTATTTYVVQAGDTLSGIAVRFGVTERALSAANGLQNLDAIVVGQQLIIP